MAYTLASCEAACASDPMKCDAITIEPTPDAAAFGWTRAVQAGPPGRVLAACFFKKHFDKQALIAHATFVTMCCGLPLTPRSLSI